MWDLDHKIGWVLNKELMFSNCGAGEDSWESIGLQGNQTVSSEGTQPWVFIERTGAEAEAPILWPPDVKSQLIEKDPDAAKIEGRRRRWWQRTGWLDDIINAMNMSWNKLRGMVKGREAWRIAVHGVTKSQKTERLNSNKNRIHKLKYKMYKFNWTSGTWIMSLLSTLFTYASLWII